MKTIYIKYNPYKVETEIKIDDELVKENSQLNVKGKRLQEWVENLPEILVEECNDSEYKIIFHGTALDFDDVQEVIEESKLKEVFNGIVFEYEHQKAQEVEDKELRIKKIFEEIQQGPFEELKGEDVKKAFKQVQNQELQVSVIATVSAGKSTLINALLGKKLMPSSQEACTATISEIQDNDKEIFEAQAFDKDGNLCATSNDLNLETMSKFLKIYNIRKPRKEKIEKIKIGLKKPVKCLETGEIFESIAEATLKYPKASISECLRGKQLTAGGLHWEYIREKDKPSTVKLKDLRYVNVECVETGKIFKSIKEAENYYNIHNISVCLSGKQKTAGGYHWRKLEEYENKD